MLNDQFLKQIFYSMQSDLVYVNYGRTEDFFKLEREMGINCTGKIVIARYGKIFRGNKVRVVFNFSLYGSLFLMLIAADPTGVNEGCKLEHMRRRKPQMYPA